MCGIVGYVGKEPALPRLISGLKKLEYRGYDSAGLAVFDDKELCVIKQAGSVNGLETTTQKLCRPNITAGIAHTRWATHGEPNETNAHPHRGCGNGQACKIQIALVHNGTLDNFETLKSLVLKRGHVLRSETDTELLVHLIAEVYKDDPVLALRTALQQVQGTFGLAVLMAGFSDRIFFARNGAPLALGLSLKGNFIASDPLAFRFYTDRMVNLEDGNLGWISGSDYQVVNMNADKVENEVETIPWSLETAEKGEHDHFMSKEIKEQPQVLTQALRGRLLDDGTVKLGGLDSHQELLRMMQNHVFVGAGTSLNAGMISKIFFQELAELSADWESASELANQKRPIFPVQTAFWAISQSGETKDLLDALKTLKQQDLPCFGIVNKVGSEIARLTGKGVYIHAGMEIAVASTKAFTNQLVTLFLIAMYLRQIRGLPKINWHDRLLADLRKLPLLVTEVLNRENEIIDAAKRYAGYPNFLYLGRGVNYPVALEGALKLKEIAYVNAIGYSAGEMKHGPIALIDGGFPTLVIAPKQDDYYSQITINIQQIRSRRGRIIAVATDGDDEIKNCVDDVIWIPQIDYYLTPILAVVPLQLFAYHIARLRGLNPDKPRNLAKSVTVK